MSRYTPISIVASVFLLLLGIAAGPARAGSGSGSYVWMVCTPGQPAITGGLNDVRSPATVTGHITPCHASAANEALAIASYFANGTATGKARAYDYDNPDEGVFTFTRIIADNAAAVCLITNPNTRLDCMAVSWMVQPDGTRVASSGGYLPTNDPLVSVNAAVNMTIPGGTNPTCPWCWG